jgi:hypothetical protein
MAGPRGASALAIASRFGAPMNATTNRAQETCRPGAPKQAQDEAAQNAADDPHVDVAET